MKGVTCSLSEFNSAFSSFSIALKKIFQYPDHLDKWGLKYSKDNLVH